MTTTIPLMERRRQYRALVVEDDEAILRLVRTVLQREGFAVECVRNGAEAIALLREVTYELLILDLMLPVLNGEAVLDFLSEEQSPSLRRVIVTTASPRRMSREFLERICRILEKPFDVDHLILIARECVDTDACPIEVTEVH
ncbi:MAG TPA: response regulator [Thermoanaerobaculia bacterium]|jgi:DNA-binding response OmpR family regulator